MPFPAKVFSKTQLMIAPKQKCTYISEQEFFYIFLHFFTKAGKSIFYNFLQFIYNCKKRPTLCVDSSPPRDAVFPAFRREKKKFCIFGSWSRHSEILLSSFLPKFFTVEAQSSFHHFLARIPFKTLKTKKSDSMLKSLFRPWGQRECMPFTLFILIMLPIHHFHHFP